MKFRQLVFLSLIIHLFSSAFAEPTPVFQYHTETTDKKDRPKSVFLWVPPDADPIRGILASTQTLMEAHMSLDSQVREVCREEGVAILFSKTGMPKEKLTAILAQFAEQSGFEELTSVPLFFGRIIKSCG